jgi:hypothetical protein
MAEGGSRITVQQTVNDNLGPNVISHCGALFGRYCTDPFGRACPLFGRCLVFSDELALSGQGVNLFLPLFTEGRAAQGLAGNIVVITSSPI